MPDAPRWSKQDTLALLLLIAGVSFFHARGLWPGQAFLPLDLINSYLPWRSGPFDLSKLQNQIISDPIWSYYPYLVHTVNEIQRGSWLLWDSQLLLGHPSVGDPLYQTFYPVFSMLSLVLGPARGFTIGLWLHAILGASLTYGWLRALNHRRAAATLGAFAYALGGYMITWFETPFWVSTLSWLPGILWVFELAIRRRNFVYVALAAFMFSLAILAGQVSFMVVFSLFLGAYALGRTIEFSRPKQLFLWPLGAAVLVLGLGTALSAIQLLPFAEALARSNRSSGAIFSPFPWQQLVTLIIPNFYGNSSTPIRYWGAGNYSGATFYVGLGTLLLAFFALFNTRCFWNRYIGFLGFGLVYFCCGGPGIAWLSHLPILRYVQLDRSIFLLSLILALLAASALQPERPSFHGLLITALVVGAVVLGTIYFGRENILPHLHTLCLPILQAIAIFGFMAAILISKERWPQFRNQFDWLLVGIVFVELYLWGAHYNPALPIDQFPPPTPGIQYLQKQAGPYRIMTKQESGEFIFGPNFLSVYGVSDLSLYSSLLSPQLRKLISAGDPGSQGYFWNIIVFGRPSTRLADLLQAGYLVLQHPLPDPGIRTEVAPSACEGQGTEIRQGHPTDGMFVPHYSAINRLDLLFRINTSDLPDSTFTVRMWQGQARDRLILENTFTRAQVLDHQPLTFYFAPEKNAPGQTYVWEISSESSQTGMHLCDRTEGGADIGVYGIDWNQVYAGELYIAERTTPLPRAYVVYATETVSNEDQAIKRLLDESYDLRNTAIVAESLPLATDRGSTPADILVYQNQRIVIQATALQPGLLVLGDYYYPGWEVFVDQQPAKMVRANLVWRGVVLSPGNHLVEFRFFPRSLRLGLGISGLGLLGLMGLILFQWRQSRRGF
jgi:hypothetical protein